MVLTNLQTDLSERAEATVDLIRMNDQRGVHYLQ